MECERKFELVSLPALMIEHMHKVVHVKKGKNGMSYGYFLNRVFSHFNIVCEKGMSGTVKKIFTLNILMENKCVEEKVRTMYQVSEFIATQENLSMKVDETRMALASKEGRDYTPQVEESTTVIRKTWSFRGIDGRNEALNA